MATIGSGNIGGTLGRLWAGKGHQVMFSSRNPDGDKIKALLAQAGANASAGLPPAAVAFAEVILLAVPANEVEGVLSAAGDLQGKVLIDATNRFDGKSAGQEVIRLANNARVVKAFNAVSWEVLSRPQFGPLSGTIFITGDDAEAKKVVAQLCTDIGFDWVDMGGAQNIPAVETALGMLWRMLSAQFGRDFAYRILRR